MTKKSDDEDWKGKHEAERPKPAKRGPTAAEEHGPTGRAPPLDPARPQPEPEGEAEHGPLPEQQRTPGRQAKPPSPQPEPTPPPALPLAVGNTMHCGDDAVTCGCCATPMRTLMACGAYGEVGPVAGDSVVCRHCGSTFRFAEGGELEPVSREEALSGLAGEQLAAAQQAMAELDMVRLRGGG